MNWDDPLSYFTRTVLEFKQHESVVHCSDWDYRLASTKTFLEAIDPDRHRRHHGRTLRRRQADVQHGLAGPRNLVWDEKRNGRALLAPPKVSHLTEGSPVFPWNDADRVLRFR